MKFFIMANNRMNIIFGLECKYAENVLLSFRTDQESGWRRELLTVLSSIAENGLARR